MASINDIEGYFESLRKEIEVNEEYKEWEETMRKYAQAYIKNENIKFITPEDIYKHLLKLKAVEQFPMKVAATVEARLDSFMSSQMKETGLDLEDQENEDNYSAA